MEERRSNSVEMVLIEIGKLQAMTSNTHDQVSALNVKVGIQNNRLSKVENWKSFMFGMGFVLSMVVLPIALKVIPEIIRAVYNKGG